MRFDQICVSILLKPYRGDANFYQAVYIISTRSRRPSDSQLFFSVRQNKLPLTPVR